MTEAPNWQDVFRWLSVLSLGVFLLLIIVFSERFFTEIKAKKEDGRDGVWIEANWGGLGGALSGWRISNSLVYLFLTCVLLGCLSLTDG